MPSNTAWLEHLYVSGRGELKRKAVAAFIVLKMLDFILGKNE